MKNRILLILNILVILFCAVMIYLHFTEIYVVTERNLAKLITLLLTYLIGVIRYTRNRKKSRKLFEEQYKDILKDAFVNNKKEYDVLMDCIFLYNDDKPGKAIKALNKLLNRCSSHHDRTAVLMFLALCYEEKKDIAHAIECYEKVLHTNMMNSTAWSNLGRLYADTERTEDALNAYQQALQCDPDNAYAYCNMAALFYRNGSYEKGLEYGLKAYELDSNLKECASVISLSAAELGNGELARKFCDVYGTLGGNKKTVSKYLEERLSTKQ